MRKLLNYFRLINMFNHSTVNLAWFKVVRRIADMANEVKEEKKPLLTSITVQSDIMPPTKLASIWIGYGDSNPIERIQHLRSQNLAMKELLIKSVHVIPEAEENYGLRDAINLALRTFE